MFVGKDPYSGLWSLPRHEPALSYFTPASRFLAKTTRNFRPRVYAILVPCPCTPPLADANGQLAYKAKRMRQCHRLPGWDTKSPKPGSGSPSCRFITVAISLQLLCLCHTKLLAPSPNTAQSLTTARSVHAPPCLDAMAAAPLTRIRPTYFSFKATPRQSRPSGLPSLGSDPEV